VSVQDRNTPFAAGRLEVVHRRVAEGGRARTALDLAQDLLVHAGPLRPQPREPLLHVGLEGVEPVLEHGDLDARLVLVVAPALEVVGPRIASM
jgi:hypothetical protein